VNFEIYKKKGYTDAWIKLRLENKRIHELLVAAWKEYGIHESHDFALLTNRILGNWSRLYTHEYKEFKDLGKSDDLRDNMSKVELFFLTMGEHGTLTDLLDCSKLPWHKRLKGYLELAEENGVWTLDKVQNYEQEHKKKVVSPLNFKKYVERQREQN